MLCRSSQPIRPAAGTPTAPGSSRKPCVQTPREGQCVGVASTPPTPYRLNDFRGILALAIALALVTGGCQTPNGTPPKVREIHWIKKSFADGQVTMELPGRINRNLLPDSGIIYARSLEQQWITFTVGSYQISEVNVHIGSSPSSGLRFDRVQRRIERIRKEHPELAGQLFIEEWREPSPGTSKFRTAVVVLPDGKRGVSVGLRTSTIAWKSRTFDHRFAIDDEIFRRMVDSLRLNGVAPPRKRFGRGNVVHDVGPENSSAGGNQ